MATFAGPTSPTALAALAPSITNLATAQRAKSQAAAGLMNTLGVQFEKQKQQEAKRQKNEAALEIAKGLIADPAFRRQMPGVTDAAGLVKVAGAENVLDFGIKTQQADRLAQQSAAQIALTQKQISEYDRQAKQREADLAAEKAEGEAFQQLVSAGGKLSDEQLGSVLSGLSPDAQVRAISLRNQLDPSKAYDIVELPNGESALIYGNQMMRISTQEKSPLPDAYNKGLALINEQFEKGTPEYDRAVQNLVDRTLGYDVASGESAFGGQPETAGPFIPTEAEQDLFSRMPNIFTEDNMVDSEKLEAELAKMDFLSPQEVERMRLFAQDQSIQRRRAAYGEEEEKPGFFQSRFPGLYAGGIVARDFIRKGMETEAKVRSAAAQQMRSAVEDIKRRIGAIEEAGLSFSFNRAKELAQERVRREQGRNQKTVLKELKDIDLKKIDKKPKNASEAKAQQMMLEVLMEMLDMGEAPIVSYGDPRMQPQPLLPVE